MNKNIPYTFSFEDIALIPSHFSIDPEDVDVSFKIGKFQFELPILSSAMDAIVDVNFAKELSKLGALPVINLEGIQTRYEHPEDALKKIIEADKDNISVIQRIYSEPIKEELIYRRIKELKENNKIVAVACRPSFAKEISKIIKEAAPDIFFVQSTVTTAKYISKTKESLSFRNLKQEIKIPIVVGNCVSYKSAYELMKENIDGVLIGVGPGAACTTRMVLGIGMPQVSAIIEVKQAQKEYHKKYKKYIPIIADGGMRTSADIIKAIGAGSDAVMLGSIFARAKESPGCGYNWGMATSDVALPRGKKIYVDEPNISLKEILFGPAISNDGTTNIVGALKQAIGMCGCRNIKELHNKARIVIAPSFLKETQLIR